MEWVVIWEINEAVLLALVALAVALMVVVWINRSSCSGYEPWIHFNQSEWGVLITYGSMILFLLSLTFVGVIIYFVWRM